MAKINAIHSAAAMVENCIAPFRRCITCRGLFQKLRIEPNSVRDPRRAAPSGLDNPGEASIGVVGINSRPTEFLSPMRARFPLAYHQQIRDRCREQGYSREMPSLMQKPPACVWLDVAKLIKDAFGLADTFRNRDLTPLRPCREPGSPDALPVFARHRQKIFVSANMHTDFQGDELSFPAAALAQDQGRGGTAGRTQLSVVCPMSGSKQDSVYARPA